MRCDKLMEKLETLAPLSYACDWDNVGLLAGRGDKEVKKILVALDATDEVIDQAIEEQVDFLLTHHPLIFKPLQKINDQNFISNRIVKLLRHDICYYAMHTNFDCAPGGMADLASGLIGLKNTQVLEYTGDTKDGVPYGVGKIGNMESAHTLEELAKTVKEVFSLPFVTIYGMGKNDITISKAAVLPGSGKSVISLAEKSGAQVLVTGDIGHHEGIDAVANGLMIIDAGHYGLEHIFIEFMVSYLKEQIDSGFEVSQAELHFPAVVL